MQAAMVLASNKAANEALEKLGRALSINLQNVEMVDALREDLHFARSMRKGSAAAGARLAMIVMTAMAGGVMIALWEGIKLMIARSGH